MNKLAESSSPYLLQHAHNPVHWYPWGSEALKEASDSNKLIVVSIGYSACHWCHVMERESFEKEEVGDLMNAHYVSIKVDREERPDVDDVYMNASLLINGSGGWPLNAICLPDGRTIFAGTYFPRGKWMQLLLYFAKTWREEPEKLKEQADYLLQGLNKMEDLPVLQEDSQLADKENYLKQVRLLDQQTDKVWGGRQGSPKFPMPVIWEWLLMDYFYLSNETSLKNTKITLDKMALGGIYDHVGGAFARYSVDSIWKVPHFEKMLYDNGQLLSLYAKAYKINPNENYERILRQTADFLIMHNAHPDGYFYSAFDADSEGEEGKFYVWTSDELRNLVDPPFFETFCDYYTVTLRGNWEHGNNILFAEYFPDGYAEKKNLDASKFKKQLRETLVKLDGIRSRREKPGLDDKSLTSWNALAVMGLLDTYEALGEERYLDFAKRSLSFLMNKIQKNDGSLHRNYHKGKASIHGFLDDYAFLISALIKMYENSFDQQWLDEARKLMQYCLAEFEDANSPLLFYTSDDSEQLILRKKETSDNVIPASNSQMAKNLFLLGHFYYQEEWIARSKNMFLQLQDKIMGNAEFYSNWMQLYLWHTQGIKEVAIAGPEALEKKKQLAQSYLPNCIFMGSTDAETTLDLLEGKFDQEHTRIYVCENKSCKYPVEEAPAAMKLIEE